MTNEFQFVKTGQFVPEEECECLLIRNDNWTRLNTKLSNIEINYNYLNKIGFSFIGVGPALIVESFLIENRQLWKWMTASLFSFILGLIFIFTGILFVVLNRSKDKEIITSIENIDDMLLVIENNSPKVLLKGSQESQIHNRSLSDAATQTLDRLINTTGHVAQKGTGESYRTTILRFLNNLPDNRVLISFREITNKIESIIPPVLREEIVRLKLDGYVTFPEKYPNDKTDVLLNRDKIKRYFK